MINIGSLVGTLELQDNATSKLVNFDQALNRTFGPFAQFHRQTNVIGIGLQALGLQVARAGDRLTALTAGIVATGIGVVKLSTDFQTNMTKIANLTEIGVQGVGRMREAVLKMGPEVAQGPLALSEALYSIGSVGLTGAKALETLEMSAKATAIGLGETKDVSRAISAAVINYAHENMTAARAADILTVAVKAGGAEADEFAKSLGRVIATGRQVGVSFEEITASVATFTRLGVRADEAVTALRGTFAFLMKPADGVVATLKKLHIEMDDVRKSVRERGLAQTLIDLMNATKGNEAIMGQIIPNVRALAGVLANAGSQAEEYKKIVEEITNSNGALNETFNRVSETAGFKFHQALARLQVLGIHLGDVLLPVFVDLAESLTPVIDLLTKLVSVFNDLPEPIKTATFLMIGFTLALGPIMSIGGRLTDVFGLFARGLTGLKAYFSVAGQAAVNFGEQVETSFRAARTMRQFHERFTPRQRYPVGPEFTGPVTETIPITMDQFTGPSVDFGTRLRFQQRAAPGFGITDVPGGDLITTVIQKWTKINQLLLAQEAQSTRLARDSAGNLAKQLRAMNLVDTEVLGKATVSVGEFTLALEDMGKVLTTEVFQGSREILRLTGEVQKLPGGIVKVGDAFVDLGIRAQFIGRVLEDLTRASGVITRRDRLLTGLPETRVFIDSTKELGVAIDGLKARFIALPRGIQDTSTAAENLGARFVSGAKGIRDTEAAVASATERIAKFFNVAKTFTLEAATSATGVLTDVLKGTFTASVAKATEAGLAFSTFLRGGFVTSFAAAKDALLTFGKVLAMLYVGSFALAIDGVMRFSNTIKNVFTVALDSATGTITKFIKFFAELPAAYNKWFVDFATTPAKIPAAIARPFNAASDIVSGFVDSITTSFGKAQVAYEQWFARFTTGTASVPEAVTRPFTSAGRVISEFTASITKSLGEAGAAYTRWFEGFTSGTASIPTAVSHPFAVATEAISTFSRSIVESLTVAGAAYSRWFEGFTTGTASIPAAVTRPFAAATEAVASFSASIRVSLTTAAATYDKWYTSFTTGTATIPQAISRPFTAASDIVANATRGLITSFKNLFQEYDRLFTKFATQPALQIKIPTVGAVEGIEETVASVAKLTPEVEKTAVAVGRLSESTALVVRSMAGVGESTALVVRPMSGITEAAAASASQTARFGEVLLEALPRLVTVGKALAVFGNVLDIALVGEIFIRTFAFIVDATDALNYTIDRAIGTIGTLAGALKDMAIVLGHDLVSMFDGATGALGRFRDSLQDLSILKVLQAGFVLILAKIVNEIERIENAAARIKLLSRSVTEADDILKAAEAKSREKDIISSPLDTAQVQLAKAELQDLIKVYDKFTTTTEQSFGEAGAAGVFDVLAERFEQIRKSSTNIKLPERIEEFLQGRGLGAKVPEIKAPFIDTGSLLGKKTDEQITESLTAKVKIADAEFKGLSKTVRDDITNAFKSHRVQLSEVVDNYKHLFTSEENAKIALKGVEDQLTKTSKAAERDTRWITTFRNGAKDLESTLQGAIASGLPMSDIIEEWGNSAQKTLPRIKAVGDEFRGTMTQFVAESAEAAEANKPFERIAAQADAQNKLAGAMLAHGRSISEVYEVMGTSAVAAGEKAGAALGQDMLGNLQLLKEEGERLELDKVFQRVTQEINEFQRAIAKTPASVQELAELNAMGERWAETAKERIAIIKASNMSEEEQKTAIRDVTDELRFQFEAYRKNMGAIRESIFALEDLSRAFEPDTLSTALGDVAIKFDRIHDNMTQAEKDADNYGERMRLLALEEIAERNNVTEAWLRHGASTRAELSRLAVDAKAQYEAMKASGLFAAKDLEEAWERMVEANILAQDKWAGKFTEMVASLPDALGDAFARMMTEAETFKEFFLGIWDSIQKSILDTFGKMVSDFISQFLKKMLTGALAAKTQAAALGAIDFSGAGLEPMLGGAGEAMAGGASGVGAGGAGGGAALIGGGALAAAGSVLWAKAGESKFKNTMGGALTGAGVGTMIMPGLGTAIGAGVGAIVGFISSHFRKSETTRIMEEIGHGLGVDISDGLAKEIEELAKTIEGGTKNQRRAIAEILSLDKIIEEGGGLSAKNVRTYEQAAMELFGVIERGGNTGKLAVGELNTLVGMFAAQADKTGGVWDKNFQAIIARAKETGLELENLTAAIQAQMDKLVSGLNKLTASFEIETKKAFIGAFANLPGGKEIGDKLWEALGDPEAMKKALEGMEDDFVKLFEAQFGKIPQLDDMAEKLWANITNPAELERQIDKLDLKPEIEKKLREFLTPFNVFKVDPKALEEMKNDFFKQFKEKFSDIPELDKIAEKLWAVIGDPKELERAIDRLDLAPAVEKKLREFLGAFDPSKLPMAISSQAQAQFDRLSRIAFASFNAIIAQGKSAVEAIDLIGDSVDRLIQIHDKLKLKGGAAYEALARFRNLVKDNRDLVDSAIGLNDAMVALTNLGGMTADIFKDLQLEGQGIFERLTAAGFTSEEALKMMAPFLQNVVKIAKEYGFSIDEATQKLIDQADKAGALDKQMMSTNDILMTGFIAIIEALGGPLPDAFKDFAESAKKDIGGVSDDLDELTRPRHAKVIIDTETGEEIEIPDTGPTEPGPGGEPRPPTYAGGGIVGARNLIPFPNLAGDFSRKIDFSPRGTDTVPALLAPKEMVLTEQDQVSLLSMLRTPQEETRSTTPPAGVVINIEEGAFNGVLSGATVDSPERARELAYAIVTEFEKRGKLWNKARNSLGISKAS